MTKKQKTSAFILGGLAVYALYKYASLSKNDKAMLADKIRTSGKELLSKVNLEPLKSALSGKMADNTNA